MSPALTNSLDPVILGVRMPPRELKGKEKAEPDADVEDEAPAAKKPKGKQKAEPDADVEDEAPAAKKTKPEKVKKKPMRRPDHGEVIYCVEYAASNRSMCKECGEKIVQGLVRLGLAVPGKGDWDDISWRHPECFMEPLEVSEEETLTAASQIERYEDLEEEDQKMIDTWFAQASKNPRKERAVLEDAAEAAAEDGGRALLGTLLQGASFNEREQLGSLGARFDYRSKTWFVPYGKDAAPFAKWLGAGAAAAIAAHAAASAEGVELKEELSARGLGTSGKKAELVGKLREALENPPAAPEAPASASGRRVDRAVPGGAQYAVYEDYDVKLSESSLVDGANVNKYYFIQVLQKQGGTFATYFKYGKIGETEYGDKLDGPFESAAEAIQSFEAKFHEKTRGKKDKSPKEAAWAAYKAGQFEKRDGYYGVVVTKVGEAGCAPDDWQKNLDDKQIEKGKAALAAIKSALSDEDKALDVALIAALSTEYYRAIPTSSGRKAPPPLDSLAVVGEKEHQLEFWLRMGFEETGTIVDNPLRGLWDLALPPTLKEACLPFGVSDLGSISSSVARGKLLARSRAGGPIKSMSADKYGAIVLYTGNSIYRELNRALREVHAEVPKYLRYLRLLFEAMDAMPTRSVRLWRGIATDLYDEYEPGKVITWWSVSSATADESVARSFICQLGGVASLIILDTKSALDITPLSVYRKEKENLLAPGTRLKVLSRTRHGNINEIHVEEIDTAVEPRPEHALIAAPEPSAVAGADADEEAEHPYSRFSVEAAKSNRSTCKGCGLKIDKGEVRIGCELEDLDGEFGGHAITQWRHVHCVKPSWVRLDELDGLGSLNKAGKTSIEAWQQLASHSARGFGRTDDRRANAAAEVVAARAALEAALDTDGVSEGAVANLAEQYAVALMKAPGELPPKGAYTDKSYIFAALKPLDGSELPPVRLLRSTWIKARAAKLKAAASDDERRLLRLPRRQDLERDEPAAFMSVEELERLPTEKQSGKLAAGSSSYCWLTPEHPDPLGQQLVMLAVAIEAAEAERFPSEAAIFIDYASLCQKDASGQRTPEEAAAFSASLSTMQLWYVHALLTAFLTRTLPDGTPEHVPGYADRGWPTCESAWVALAKVSRVIFRAPVWEVGATTAYARPAPMAPGALARLLARKRFTSKKADLPMVVELNTRTILSLFADAEELGYAKLGWRDADLVQLCEVLPLCSALRRLMLYENVLKEAGLQAFAKVCANGAIAKLERLFLYKNQIGDVGCTALASACATGALAQLEILNLDGNQIGDAGVSALASACATGALAKLEMLVLAGNQIGDAGVIALADACATGAMASLKDLRLHSNQIGDAGVTALADACALGAMAKLESLELSCNKIGDAGVSALASACATGALAKLEKLELRGNNIDDIGVTAFASAFDTGALASLSELEMGNGPMGADHPKLKAACKKRGIDLCGSGAQSGAQPPREPSAPLPVAE